MADLAELSVTIPPPPTKGVQTSAHHVSQPVQPRPLRSPHD